ncbi:MAG TPA: hypothetical protein VGC41_03740 [Kofleriaceae bacterium]
MTRERKANLVAAILVSIGIALGLLVYALTTRRPGDPMQPWVVAIAIAAFTGLAPALVVRAIILKKN